MAHVAKISKAKKILQQERDSSYLSSYLTLIFFFYSCSHSSFRLTARTSFYLRSRRRISCERTSHQIHKRYFTDQVLQFFSQTVYERYMKQCLKKRLIKFAHQYQSNLTIQAFIQHNSSLIINVLLIIYFSLVIYFIIHLF